MRSYPVRNKKPGRGFMLIEVLVSLLIFSLGVVGLMGMQARAIQAGTDAQNRDIAARLANQLSSQMQIGRTTDLNAANLTAWKALVAAELPKGEGEVTQVTTGSNAKIEVTWLAPAYQTTPSPPKSRFQTQVVLAQ
ncbi:fimbrial assembly protein [Comamonas testosteroni]